MFKYFAFAAAFASIGKAALDCDGALVDGTTAWIAGACTVSSTPDLTVSYQQKCTDTDLIQYFYDNEECLGEPTSSTTVCTGPNAVGSCEITCDGTPCVYVESVVETDVIECDGTMVLNATELVIDAKLLDFCILQGNSSQMYTELNGDIMIDFYDTMNCSGAAIPVTLEDRCSEATGFASSYSIQTAMRTMDPIPQPLECDGAVVTSLDGDAITTSAYIAGACIVSSTPSLTTSYMQICTDDGDVVQVFYDSADCSGDITSTSASVCSGAISCDISCRGIPCDYVATKVESGFTECNGLSAVDPTQFVVQPNPLNYCVYNLERDTSSQYTVENGGIVWNVYDGVVDCRGDGIPIEEEDTCSVENGGSAISYVTGTAINTVVEPLGCDGAIVIELENDTTTMTPYIAGACQVSSSPNLTVSLMQQCTEDDVIQYVFDNADCSGDPVSSSSVCTGDNAMGSCVITCTGTPCEYVEITASIGFTECDGTSPVDPTTTVVQPFPLNYCSYDAEQDESSDYTVELDGNTVYNTYAGDGCSGDPTSSSVEENICFADAEFQFATSSTTKTAEYTMVGEGPPEPLGCDGAVVSYVEDGEMIVSPWMAGACQVSSSPVLTVSYQQKCTDDDLIQYFYDNTECLGEPTSFVSVCTGPNAFDCAEISCTGTPCDYVESVSASGVTECDGTMVLNSTGFVSQPYLLGYCRRRGDSSQMYTELNGDIILNFYGTTDCSGAATSVTLEDTCDDVNGFSSAYSVLTAMDTMDEPPQELGCDGTIVFGTPIVSGTCQVQGDSSIMYECSADDMIGTFYESTDCSGDAIISSSLCAGDTGLDCTVSCDGIQCDVVYIMSYENVTECNDDGTPVDGILYSQAIPLDFCLYGISYASDGDSGFVINAAYPSDDCSGDPTITYPAENMCNATDGYAVVYSSTGDDGSTPTPTEPTTPSPTHPYGFTVTGISCSASATCGGVDCTMETIDEPEGCVMSDEGEYSMAICEDGWYNQTYYETEDCSGDPVAEISLPTGQCLDLSELFGVPGSLQADCEVTTAAPTTAEPTTAPTEDPTMEPTTTPPTTAGDSTDGQYRIESVVSATFVCFVLSFLV